MDWWIGQTVVAAGWALIVWLVGTEIVNWWQRRR
jgi:hypothetical protein